MTISLLRSKHGKLGLKLAAYSTFNGLDTSRDVSNMDNQRSQHFSLLDNGYTDWRGQIVRDPPVIKRADSPRARHIMFFADGEYVWAVQDQSGRLGLRSTRGHQVTDAFPDTSNPATVIFNRQAHIFARGQTPINYNGSIFARIGGEMGRVQGGYPAVVARRIALAGIPSKPNTVEISRVDQLTLVAEERTDETSVLRAGSIDVSNLLGTSGQIMGVSPFEQDRLLIFSQDRTLLYRIDPDIDQWQLDDRANLMVGCISHNTIVRAGVDVLFCSRSGVHNVQRSPDNGILVYSRSLSDKVDILYRQLVKSVPDKESISATFDQDEGRYHIFFPQPGGVVSRRLSLALNPEENQTRPSWSTGTYLNPTCGDFLNGQLVMGGSDGVYEVLKIEDTIGSSPTCDVLTPILWHGNALDEKTTHSLIIQASGTGTIEIDAFDEEGKPLLAKTVEIEGDPDDNAFDGVPLFQQYETPFQTRYRGVRLRMKMRGSGAIRLFGFGVTYRND